MITMQIIAIPTGCPICGSDNVEVYETTCPLYTCCDCGACEEFHGEVWPTKCVTVWDNGEVEE